MLKRYLVLLLCMALTAPALAGGWGGRYHYGYGGHFGGHYRGHGGGDEGAALLAGLVIGGLVGWFINEDRHYYRERVYRDDPYPRDYYYAPPTGYRDYGYAPPPPRKYVRVVPRVEAPSRVEPEFAGRNCRMTREYTTTIEIDGEQREAYGTRCLTADGSWVLGSPKLVPEPD
jgi:hypothetical protein